MQNQSISNSDSFENLRSLVALELQQVDLLILKYAKSHVELVPMISNYLTSAGGKRLRPILTLACAKIFGKVPESAIKLATAVEFIHTATLLHDDVIDESEKRRGKPTANNVWDNKACILVGDFLFSQAFKLMVETHDIEALKLLSNASAVIAESEVWQLELINNIELTIKDYIKLVKGKTAELFAAACATGAIVSGCSEPEKNDLFNFGLNLGISFQIIDDVLDYTASDKFGKKLGNDFLEGKVTLPIILAYKNASEHDKILLKSMLSSTNKNQESFTQFKMLLDTNAGLAQSIKIAEDYSAKATAILDNLKQNPTTNTLKEFSNFLLQRII
jgi:octaprenyl-diphosphate synthase